MTALELLESLNLLDEHEHVEAKTAQDVGKSLLETICAFANEPGLGGGWVLLGAQRDERAPDPSYEVVGLRDPDKIVSDLASQCASMFNQPLRVDIRTESLRGKVVAVVHVPELAGHDKPVFLKAQGLPRGAFRRIGSSDQRCTEDDLIALYQGRQQESFDAGLVTDAELDDFALEALAEYRQSRAEANPDAEELRWSDDELLQALGAVRPGQAGRWLPTVAGLMLFGKPAALRRCFPMIRVDYIRVPGREWVPDPERRFDTLELRDPLFRLIRRAQAAILDDLPKAFGLADGDLQRQDRPVIPQRVIREAVVNALMHRSYRSHAPIQIIRFANRLEIRNPGFSLKSPEHLGDPGSTPRNPKIASVLHETRFAETKGSGIRVMREMAEAAGLAPPLFESDRGQDLFVARFFFHHFLGEDDLRWLAGFKDLGLNEAEARALVVAREAGAMDNATYRDLNKLDTLTASNALRRLRDAGLFTQQGRGSATWYRPTAKLRGEALIPASLSSNPLALSSKPGPLSSNLGPLSSNPPVLSSKLDGLQHAQRAQQAQLARADLVAEMPVALAGRLAQLGKRRPPQDVRNLVEDLCAWQALRADDLALLLQRQPETVRQDYLRPLLRQGRIVMTRPDKPNDPAQAYRAVGAQL
ncbi:ATP-binding protein [Roseateles sp.]|uniref:ATP-binding protein n=1 Tax=Roseateles sp. TaxID=1971397 RepID=UPI00286CF8A4|nr:ATP-binding protein [Roseateles sp.]